MNLILCGYKNCGKTTIASAFAKTYDYQLIDTDQLICEKYNAHHNTSYNIREIHQNVGEANFRDFEKSVVQAIRNIPNTIIATGGGALTQTENQQYLQTLGSIVYLYVEPEELKNRMLQQNSLPNFIRAEFIAEDFSAYINSRTSLYENVAHHVLDITHKTVDECVFLLNQLRCQHGQ